MQSAKTTVPKGVDRTEFTLRKLIKKRDEIFSRLQTVFDYSENAFKDEGSKELFLCSVESLDNLHSEFDKILDEINETEFLLNPASEPNFQSWSSFEDLYCRCKHVLNKLTLSLNPTKREESSPKKQIRLPKLDLVGFSGDPIQWPIFYESFKSTIHDNPDLTDNERVQYLIGKLSGRALSVCTGIAPNADNYKMIWKLLIEKYEDKRSLATAYVDQMFEFKPFNVASSKNLDLFLEKICSAVSSLKSLKIDNLSDFLLLYFALQKIDSETARAFEMSKRNTTLPTYDDLVTFLHDQSKILERTSTSTSKRVNDVNKKGSYNSKPTHAFVSTLNDTCSLCKQNKHYNLYKCPEFYNLSVDERFNFINGHNGCNNCLSLMHNTYKCNSNYVCRFCRHKHHSLLCRQQNSSKTLSDNKTGSPDIQPRAGARCRHAVGR